METSSHKSLSEGILKAKELGYQKAFRYANQRLIERESNTEYVANQCVIEGSFRLEGLSDPADNSILFLLSCDDGTKGYISSAYGIYADLEMIEFMLCLEKR